MALKHLTLPNGTTLDINDARSVVIGDDIYNVVALTSEEYQALPVKDENTLYIVTDSSGGGGGGGGDITPSATVHNSLISIIMNEETVGSFTTNSANAVNINLGTVITQIKTINNQSLIGTGNITISGGGGSGDENVIEAITFNGAAVPVTNKTAAITASIPPEVTESTVSGWGFTKNTGTYSKPSGGIPATDLASAVQTSLGKADTALQSYTETDPTVPSWAKASTKPTYTASEVGALPDTTSIPNESTVSGWGFTKNSGTITGITMNGSSKGTSGVVNLGTVVTSETDPVFTASAAHGISSTDISNWNAKQKAITVSTSEPTSSQGSNGDIWIVI